MITIKQQMNWETDWISEDEVKRIEAVLTRAEIEYSLYEKFALYRVTVLNVSANAMRELGIFSVELWNE